MKWIWTLVFAAAMTAGSYSEERLEFPFSQATRVTFIRLGNLQMDAGQQFVLTFKDRKQWVIERRISRTQETFEEIEPERAQEILKSFSSLYTYWQTRPYCDSTKGGYSMYIACEDTWRMALNVKDRGSPALNGLLDTIGYPDGLQLYATTSTNSAPGVIRASTTGDPEAAGTGSSK